MNSPYSKTAQYYDKFYTAKDYASESLRLRQIVKEKNPEADTWLDVACGTGMHILHLRQHFQIQGLDRNPEFLAIASQRNPDTLFHCADMMDFNLGTTFDVVSCLFSAIGHVKAIKDLRLAIRNMARHLNPGGLLLIEPWFTPDAYHTGTPHALLVDEPDLKIARLNTSQIRNNVSVMEMHYLIATPQGTEHAVENFELGLFTTGEMQSAMEDEGLAAYHDEQGLTGRGLHIGRKGLIR